MINDYAKLRAEMGLAAFPDAMVETTGRDVETRILMGEIVTPKDLAWLVEATHRAERAQAEGQG